MKFKLIFTLVFTLLASSTNAATYYVKQTGTGDGSAWDNSSSNLRSILEALPTNNSDDPVTIYVASGDYKLSVTSTDTFRLKKGIMLYGGFNPLNTGTASGDRDVVKFTTILNGNGHSRSVAVVTSESTGATSMDTRIDGFVITGGNRTTGGGGMYNGANPSPVIANCTFFGNIASGDGGGMTNGANSSPTITNCTFSGNTAKSNGGGLSNSGNNSPSPTIINCTFSENTATLNGGGIYNSSASSSPIFVNTIFWGNKATSGNEIYHALGTVTLKNCVLGAGVFVGTTTSFDMVRTDPKIVSVDSGGVVLIYKLQSDSPAIDAGLAVGTHTINNKNVTVPSFDQLGKIRVSADIGAFEWYQESVSVTGVSLDKSTMPLSVDKTETLTATVEPSNATNQSIIWSSSSTDIATASADAGNKAVVKGISAGNAVITVSTVDGIYTDTCAITVSAANPPSPPPPTPPAPPIDPNIVKPEEVRQAVENGKKIIEEKNVITKNATEVAAIFEANASLKNLLRSAQVELIVVPEMGTAQGAVPKVTMGVNVAEAANLMTKLIAQIGEGALPGALNGVITPVLVQLKKDGKFARFDISIPNAQRSELARAGNNARIFTMDFTVNTVSDNSTVYKDRENLVRSWKAVRGAGEIRIKISNDPREDDVLIFNELAGTVFTVRPDALPPAPVPTPDPDPVPAPAPTSGGGCNAGFSIFALLLICVKIVSDIRYPIEEDF